MKLRGEFQADGPLMVTLRDGRTVSIHDNGSVSVHGVRGVWSGYSQYSLELPTFEYVAEHCPGKDDINGGNELSIPIYHQH